MATQNFGPVQYMLRRSWWGEEEEEAERARKRRVRWVRKRKVERVETRERGESEKEDGGVNAVREREERVVS